MPKFSFRLVAVVLLSALGIAITQVWYSYQSDKINDSTKGKKRVARLITKVSEVERKPIKKLIWLPLYQGEDLYVGETIRTGPDAEAIIEFLESKVRIDLESDSAVVLEENALDFLQGNLFIDAAEDSKLILKSGDDKLAVNKSELALSKKDKGLLDVNVLTGDALVTRGDTKTTVKAAPFQVLWPKPNQVIAIDPSKSENLQFKWAGDLALYNVTLELGTSRKNLRAKPETITPGSAGELSTLAELGRVYYRLRATPLSEGVPELTTPILKAEVVSKSPPLLVEPAHKSHVHVAKDSPLINFEWASPINYSKVIFELNPSKDFKKSFYIKELEAQTNHKLQLKSEGIYYWRVTGFIDGLDKPIQSETFGFRLKISNELSAPVTNLPTPLAQIPVGVGGQQMVKFAWSSVERALDYKIEVFDENQEVIHSLKTPLTSAQWNNFKVGKYLWQVTAQSETETSKPSSSSAFTVTELPQIEWSITDDRIEYFYDSDRPEIYLEWKPFLDSQKNSKPTYKVSLKYFDKSGEEKNIDHKTVSSLLRKELLQDGLYTAVIEAFDKDNKTLAKSEPKAISVLPVPLLPAPRFSNLSSEEILASARGLTQISWTKVSGAKEYKVLIKSDTGIEKSFSFNSEVGELKGLMPGEYQIWLRSVDGRGRPGPTGESRILRVPATSDVRAPKLRGFKVK